MSQNTFSRELLTLVADIGGTNARFALSLNGKLQQESVLTMACSDFKNLDHAVYHYLSAKQVKVNQSCMAFACPVANRHIQMTNSHWNFDQFEMKKTLALESFKVINDFTAQALSIPHIDDKDLIKVGGGKELADATKLIIGPGTGLGIAGLKKVGKHWLPLPTEGGHAGLSPMFDNDIEIFSLLKQRIDYVSWEIYFVWIWYRTTF